MFFPNIFSLAAALKHSFKSEILFLNRGSDFLHVPPPQRVTGNSEEEGALKRPKFLKESMSRNWNFRRGQAGWGFKPKKPSLGGGGGYGYFLEQHILP